MTRTITTAAELETLLIAVGEHAEPAIVYEGQRPWIITESEEGEFWGWSYREEDDHPLKNAADLKLPLRVLHIPGEQDRPLPDRDTIAKALYAADPITYINREGHHQTLYDWEDAPNPLRRALLAQANAVLALIRNDQ